MAREKGLVEDIRQDLAMCHAVTAQAVGDEAPWLALPS
jgi:hypothetical protein